MTEPREFFDDNDVRAALLEFYERTGSYAEMARQVGISDEYARQAVLGMRPVRGDLLAFLGFECVTVYRAKDQAGAGNG